MANVADAALALAGIVVGVEATTDYETKAPNGAKVLVASTGGGYANVKLDNEQLAYLRPDFGQSVAWLIKLSPYKMGDRDAQLSCRFITELNDGHLGQLAAAVKAPASK